MRSPTLFIVFSTLVTSVSSHCTSSWLRDVTNTYTFALSAGKPEFFTRAYIGLNTSYTESDRPLDLPTGILSKGINITRRFSIHDTVDCSTVTNRDKHRSISLG